MASGVLGGTRTPTKYENEVLNVLGLVENSSESKYYRLQNELHRDLQEKLELPSQEDCGTTEESVPIMEAKPEEEEEVTFCKEHATTEANTENVTQPDPVKCEHKKSLRIRECSSKMNWTLYKTEGNLNWPKRRESAIMNSKIYCFLSIRPE